jgi:hypothetical protein
MNLRRALVAGAVCLPAALISVPAARAGAAHPAGRPGTRPVEVLGEVKLKVGQTYVKDYPAIQGADAFDAAETNNAAAPSHEDPAGCADHPGCEDIPLTLDVPKATLKGNSYVLNVEVSWDTQARQENVPLVVNAYGDQLGIFLYTRPIPVDKDGNEQYADYAFLEPANVSAVSPTGTVDLLVVNQSGVNTGYTVKATLIDNSVAPSYYPGYGGPGANPAPTRVTTTVTRPGTSPVRKPGQAPGQSTTTVTDAPTNTVTTVETAPVSAPLDAPAVATVLSASVVVGRHPQGQVNSALQSLAGTPEPARLGLHDEAFHGNRVTVAVAATAPSNLWVLVALLVPPALGGGWVAQLARRRRRRVS